MHPHGQQERRRPSSRSSILQTGHPIGGGFTLPTEDEEFCAQLVATLQEHLTRIFAERDEIKTVLLETGVPDQVDHELRVA